MAGGRDRLAMLELAVADEPLFLVSGIELERDGPSYSIDTVRAVLERRPEGAGELHWILGGDNLPGLPAWREAEEFLRLVQPIIHRRAGDDPRGLDALEGRLSAEAMERMRRGWLAAPPITGRATYLRASLSRGGRHADLHPAVVDYALRRALYGPAGSLH